MTFIMYFHLFHTIVCRLVAEVNMGKYSRSALMVWMHLDHMGICGEKEALIFYRGVSGLNDTMSIL